MSNSIIKKFDTGSLSVPIVSLAPAMGYTLHPRIRARQGRKKATHCKRNHALIEPNLYYAPNGERQCATCRDLYKALRSGHGSVRAHQEGRNASGSRQSARSPHHPVRHSPRSQEGTPWRQKGQFRSNGKAALQTAGG
jgi:hypothetical protein